MSRRFSPSPATPAPARPRCTSTGCGRSSSGCIATTLRRRWSSPRTERPSSTTPVPTATCETANRSYLARHVGAAADALDVGVPLHGYFVWSLLDNFEWDKGYEQRFGIVRVDYPSQRRTLKASGEWYRALLHAAWAHRRATPG